MILVSTNNLSKSFGISPLFVGINLVVEQGDRIGLIGPNGAGKSTLLKILAGEISADSGELSYKRGVRIGRLDQTPSFSENLTIREEISRSRNDCDTPEGEAIIAEVLSQLELTQFEDLKINTLSGGWKKRVALARELAKEPELLLLDEPTNHLDVESILWLEGFLSRSPIATVTITHDRYFLQNVSNRILELDRRNPGGLLSVKGNYLLYVEAKEKLLTDQQSQETRLRNKLRRETEWLRRGPKARTTKQQARIHAAHELESDVEELTSRNRSKSAQIRFESMATKTKRLIEAKSITKELAEKTLFSDLSVIMGPGDRVGLLGVNGCGKSTLIKILMGEASPTSGSVYRAEKLAIAYFEQTRETLDFNSTPRKTLCPSGDQVNYRGKMVHIHGYLDRFLFRREQVDMSVGKLSGGEQSRLLLARLMLKESNFLILDEPTNDLDAETLDVLEDCLSDFEGAVLFVTHDRYFMDQVATQVLAFPGLDSKDRTIVSFADLNQWEQWRKNLQSSVKQNTEPSKPKPDSNQRKRKLSYHEVRELEQMEQLILKAESTLESLQGEAALPKNMSNASVLSELYSKIGVAQSEVERLYSRWSELEELKKQSS